MKFVFLFLRSKPPYTVLSIFSFADTSKVSMQLYFFSPIGYSRLQRERPYNIASHDGLIQSIIFFLLHTSFLFEFSVASTRPAFFGSTGETENEIDDRENLQYI